MELDTGSAISTLPLETYKETFPNTPLIDTTAILKTYSGEEIPPEGKLLVRVEYNNQIKDLTLYVVKTQGPRCLEEIGYTRYNSIGKESVLFQKNSRHKTPRRN